jgi:hypothetical protein
VQLLGLVLEPLLAVQSVVLAVLWDLWFLTGTKMVPAEKQVHF